MSGDKVKVLSKGVLEPCFCCPRDLLHPMTGLPPLETSVGGWLINIRGELALSLLYLKLSSWLTQGTAYVTMEPYVAASGDCHGGGAGCNTIC